MGYMGQHTNKIMEKKMKKFFEKLKKSIYTHQWFYERRHNVIVRACDNCLKTQESAQANEQELCSWTKINWENVEQLSFKDI
jgi:hypothetical protein